MKSNQSKRGKGTAVERGISIKIPIELYEELKGMADENFRTIGKQLAFLLRDLKELQKANGR